MADSYPESSETILYIRSGYSLTLQDDPEQPISETNIATLHKDDPFLKNIPEERILGRYTALGTQSWK